MGPLILESLYCYRATLVDKIEKSQDTHSVEFLKEELKLVDEAIAAPNRPFFTNYQAPESEGKSHMTGAGVLNLKN